jgi:hypothetical protein
MSAEKIHFFLHLRDQLIDSFVEVYIGKYGRSKVSDKNAVITLHNLTEAGAVRFCRSSIKYLQGPLTKVLTPFAN